MELSKKEFITLLMLYAAEADMEITEEERDWICSHFGPEICKDAQVIFTDSSDYEIIQAILANKERHYPGRKGTDELVGLLEELFQADHDYSRMEENVMIGLRQLFKD